MWGPKALDNVDIQNLGPSSYHQVDRGVRQRLTSTLGGFELENLTFSIDPTSH